MDKIKSFLKEYKVYLITLLVALIVFNIKLPYYVLAPGGIIPIDNRIEVDNNKTHSDGSINLLYVSQYEGNVSSLLLSLFMKNWDVEKLEEVQLPKSVKTIGKSAFAKCSKLQACGLAGSSWSPFGRIVWI